MDRLEAMTLLREAVDHGSLSAAGRALRIPVPTLSRKISDLEARIGTRLLVRTTRSLTLTDAGATYLTAARRILHDVEAAEREAAGELAEPKGELVLTAPIQFGRLHVLPTVADFLERFPAIGVRLVLNDRNVHLVDDEIDMAVRIGPLADSAMVATKVGALRIVTAASPAFLDRHGTPKTPDDLRDRPVVAVDGPMAQTSWPLTSRARGGSVDVALSPRLAVTTTEAAADAAILGVGFVRLLHYQVSEAVEAGRLRLVLEDAEPVPVPVHLVHATHGQMPLKLRRFIDFAVRRLRERLSRLPRNGHRP
ncbi:LysR family transcriptional regulator [Aureimonas jatrophae]|uniref:DNA-binding transcriptional regulator, LysR family n=1 Tax=Aureimonas jatrophae TaxID=1166073 RepID=A0A1H0DF59_9HYPH|nr:LysR family transcriptional regulator [Aureimonas jatrophae]MBB3951861.1 DNA-binding transcriptional LysR family regulator [Aureimonas jatrophae]SDN68805.1 DNA-binding transcriptional regulator, LysR family [Aureimonas jatrophae]